MIRAIQIRAPDALEDQVARDLEQAVAEEEQPAAKPVGGVAQAQVALQLGCREPDVHAVDVGDDVAEEDERDEAADDARNRRAALRRHQHQAS